ncbi:MAG: GGDEF domain-containing protein [Nitrospirae bacterium]|nr:GGDEF domain-containing protein [Nitrospirota bacterium]
MKERLKVYIVLVSALFIIAYIVSEYYAEKLDKEIELYNQRLSIIYYGHGLVVHITGIQKDLYSLKYGTLESSDDINAHLKELEQGIEGISKGVSYIFYSNSDDELFRVYSHHLEVIERLYPGFMDKVNAVVMSGESDKERNVAVAIDNGKVMEVFVKELGDFLGKEYGEVSEGLPTVIEKTKWIRNIINLSLFSVIVVISFVVFHSCKYYKRLLPLLSAIKDGNYDCKADMNGVECGREIAAMVDAVTERIKEAKNLSDSLTIVDPLTMAYNRRYFDIRINEEMSRCIRYGTIFSLSLIDIDHFKVINDTLGHQVGDLVLKELVMLTKENVRETDMVVRYGGEEFAIIYPCTPKSGVLAHVERLRKMVESYKFTGLEKPLTISIGVADSAGKSNIDQIIQEADSNLYVAKNSGRNRCVAGVVTT